MPGYGIDHQSQPHAGPRLVQFILDQRSQWPLWKEAYQEANDLLTQTESMSPIEMRLGEYFAAIATAIPIIHADRKSVV